MLATEMRGRDAAPSTPKRPETPEPDAVTLERARRGDVGAFEQLYRAYVDRVHGLCLRLCGDAARAEDLTQEVFVRVWERLHAFEGRSRFFTWLYRVTVNQVTDAMRSEMQRAAREISEARAQAPERADPRSEPSALAIDLEAALPTLPAGARAVFVLHDIEGYTHEEIGATLGIAAGTSKAQLHRARSLLRRQLCL
jgi:RNA polymerase sigma-70 factor (ECF subfamily)